MAQCKTNFQFNELKFGIKNGTKVTLEILSNAVSDSNDKSNFPDWLFLTNTQVLRLRKAFSNNSSANMKL